MTLTEAGHLHDYFQAGIVYAGSPGPGICGIVGGTLGWLDTFSTPVPDQVEIRLSVFPVQGAATVCTSTFAIFRKRVWISAVEGVLVEAPPGVLDNTARLINPVSHNVLSFGTSLLSPIRNATFLNVAPRCFRHSKLGIFLFAASAKTSDKAWNSAGSVKAPFDTRSMP